MPLLQIPHGTAEGGAFSKNLVVLSCRLELPGQRCGHGAGHGIQRLPQGVLIRYGNFCRVGGRCRPGIGHKVGNGHIRFVSHGRDHRDLGIVNGVGHDFFIERPQILNGAATPANDQKIGKLVPIGIADGCCDLSRSLRALDTDR